MDNHMSWLVKAYGRLLTDVHLATGLPLGTPVTADAIRWLLVEAPKLDKLVMQYLEICDPEKVETGREAAPQDAVAENLKTEILSTTPDWLFPLMERVVDRERSTAHIRYCHQLLVFGYKVEHEPTTQQLNDAQASFEETDDLCDIWWNHAVSGMGPLDRFWSLARSFVCQVIGNIDWNDISPSHGPGAVYPSQRPSAKSRSFVLRPSIEEHYPFSDYFVTQPEGLFSRLSDMDKPQDLGYDIIASMVAVPKDSRGPRLISVHPSECIWIQQGQRRLLEKAIEHHKSTRGRINFRSQSINGSLALSSSLSRQFMTIDLKEASDRISKHLVRLLFGDYAYAKISCSRATHVKLLDNRVRELKKWAPMGNALCFPVESLVFWALVRAGICTRHRLTTCDDVYVFGDDIIVPSKYHEGCMYGLVRSGLVPNLAKTYRRGFFRESCGVDAYHGEDITPLRVKASSAVTIQGAISLCDLAKRARLQGYEHLAGYLYAYIRRLWKLHLCNNLNATGLYEYVGSFREILLHESRLRFYRSHQVYRVPATQLRATIELLRSHDWNHVLDALCSLSLCGDTDVRDGIVYAVPYREQPTYGWAPIE